MSRVVWPTADQLRVHYTGFYESHVTLTPDEQRRLCSNSVERVLNLALEIAEQQDTPKASVLIEDIQDLKSIITKLWVAAHSAIYAKQSNTPSQVTG